MDKSYHYSDLSDQQTNGHPFVHYVLIFITCFFAFFVNNQMIPADLMESRNLATAQEMIREGNYLAPTMNGEPRFEKPPLPTWIAAGVEQLIPENLVAQRCAAGLAGTLMIVFLYMLVSRMTRSRNLGLVSALILATCFNVVLIGRTVTWDIYCHAFMLGAIYYMVRGFEEPGTRWGDFTLSGVFLGLSFLGKGPVSFYTLLLPFLVAYILTYRPKIKGKKRAILVMILLALLISFWWPAYLYFFYQDAAVNVAQKESSSWMNHNVRPWYYYWKFPAEAGIWALFWVSAIVAFFVGDRDEGTRRENRFFFVWMIASLVFLSLMPMKKSRYLLPLLVPGAVVIGFYIRQAWLMSRSETGRRNKFGRFLFRLNTIVIALILFAIPIALYIMFYRQGALSLAIQVVVTALSWCLVIFMLRSIYGKQGILVTRVFGAVVASMVMIEGLCLIPIGKMFINPERHSIREVREMRQLDDLPFYYNEPEGVRMELVYETNRTIRPIDLTDSVAVHRSLPFVLISGAPIDQALTGKNVQIEPVGHFDNNWRKPESSDYNPDLVKQVAVMRVSPTETEKTEQ